MKLQYRIELLHRLGDYILSSEPGWVEAKEKASLENGWFIPEFVELACSRIANNYLRKSILETWPGLPASEPVPKSIGIAMAGNIPLVGFHDWLCVFIAGHKARVKLSSRDQVLLKHLVGQLVLWEPAVEPTISFEEMLKGCDAYIATGSNNTSRYFEYYFGKYPHIIRRNRTSVAVLTGKETTQELERLADDVYQFFGLGCRNVTKIYVPGEYDFVPLLEAFRKYGYLADHHKFKNNYDYNLALHLLNKVKYMTNGSLLVIENASLFSPISQLNYEHYADQQALYGSLEGSADIQCIVSKDHTSFGHAQQPAIDDYADGISTISFLAGLDK